jgi:chaperonin cofactor prefoldin
MASVGKDQDVDVTQNWGVGGKEHFQLEELKVSLEKLESKLNAIESKGDSGSDAQKKIDELKKRIDDLSDSLNGDRLDRDG